MRGQFAQLLVFVFSLHSGRSGCHSEAASLSSGGMDFENLFSRPPNPALGRKQATDSDNRINDEIDDTEIEETQEEKIKWEVKLECEPVPKKFRHFGNSTSPKSLLRRKSRSKDYDVYSDDVCSQESEDNFAKELQQYIQAKEMAKAAQSSPFPEEAMKKEGVKGTQKAIKQNNKKLKAARKNGKQKKMKRKWAGTADGGSNAPPGNRGSQEQGGDPREKQPHMHMSQGFINQHTVERKGKQVCKYFLERKCIKGDQCKFDHDAEIEKKKEMCKFYVQGYCTRGENCLYLHNEYPCKFYHTGTKCYQGEHCKFSHAPLTADTQELLAKVLDTEKKAP
ncbi:PREDICTED: zinc finger CCCH domain-containing protein 8 [Hipposideros armiger]|uniref:Zinc finger CCCH domain-containing protein 8 n=1 Tax=Hipposideros armiger TaxID=186990 RepID=A0A8B7T2U2_HIPAR|nr:PREDICTED: zinc finger CCCH domain-containing protein 8 [Hipposideros armiger]